jgi:Protein of unknown function (DUF2442)
VKEKIVHDIHRVESFEIAAPYTLRVRFEDDTEQIIDFEPVLAGELFGPLRNLSVFNEVRIDSEVHTLVWPNGADFEPATLHDWPDLVAALTAQAKEWESVPA